jgi:glycyl-tRNA synthetase beta chain
MLRPAIDQLTDEVVEALEKCGLKPRQVASGFTPRRLVLMLEGVPASEADKTELVTGPPVGAAFDGDGKPTRAAIGFAARCEVEPDALERIETDKGEYVGVHRRVLGRSTSEVLSEVVPKILAAIGWPKTMRWGAGDGPWVRPVHGLLALYKGSVVPMSLFGIAADCSTCGHPTLSPESFRVRGASDYLKKLEARDIEVDFAERRRRLKVQMEELAAVQGGVLVEDPALLDKLASICEIPGVMEGRFDRGFLSLPREVLVTSLRDHQSAFTVEKDGELLPVFLTVMDRADDPTGRVRAGNEWVVAARLADGRFFYEEDRKRALAERAPDLASLTFHVKLGSYADKGERIAGLAAMICRELNWDDDVEAATQAAHLLKVDLTTEMVKEFTSLQGIMGGLYAREEGYTEGVWQAIYDQYLPASTSDSVARGRIGRVCGLADRIDTLVGIFGLGLVPTGSKDPFGLRRAAQAVLRTLLEGDLALDWELVAVRSASLYGDRLSRSKEEILTALRPFIDDRVRHLLALEGFAYDEIEAALGGGASNLPDLRARVEAIHQARENPEFLSIVLAAKRIANIVKDADDEDLEESQLVDDAERDLHQALVGLRETVEDAVEERAYPKALAAVASLAGVLDRFFVEVLVMAEDPDLRRNRLALLQEIQRTVSRAANLTEIVVDKGEYR